MNSANGCFPELEFQPSGSPVPIIGRCRDGSTCPPYTACCGSGNGYIAPYYSSFYNTNVHPITGTVANCGSEITGCIDPNAVNFDPCATSGVICGMTGCNC